MKSCLPYCPGCGSPVNGWPVTGLWPVLVYCQRHLWSFACDQAPFETRAGYPRMRSERGATNLAAHLLKVCQAATRTALVPTGIEVNKFGQILAFTPRRETKAIHHHFRHDRC